MDRTSPPSSTGRTRRNNKTKALSRPRSNRSQILLTLVGLICILCSIINAETDRAVTDIIIILSSALSWLFLVVEVLVRALYAVEEYNHLTTRYENSVATLLKDVFHSSTSSTLVVALAIFMYMTTSMKYDQGPFKLWYDLGHVSLMTSLIGAFILARVVNLQCGPLYDSLWIERCKGLDYGSGLAHSFFHGYLKLVIPKTGTSEKHLEELMKDYEDKHHVKLEFYKVFILIPKSLHCFTSLKDTEFSPSIEESSSLDPKVITVAGVQNRVYKNSVYKIKSDRGRKVYVCAEYATPLKTFKDVVNYNGTHSENYKKHKNDIVLQFYLTLKQVLKEQENCTNYCELIFYDDKDENDRYKDVGQVLLQRIKKLQRTLR